MINTEAKKGKKQKTKNIWNNKFCFCEDERGDIRLPSVKIRTKAGLTPNIPMHLVWNNWIKNSWPEVKIVPLCACCMTQLLSVHTLYFSAATPSARVYKEDSSNETCKGGFQEAQKKTGLSGLDGKAEFRL